MRINQAARNSILLSALCLFAFSFFSECLAQQASSGSSSNTDFSSKQLAELEAFLKQSTADHQKEYQRQVELTLKGLSLLLQDPAALLAAYKEAYIFMNFKGLPDEASKTSEWESKNKATWKTDTFMWCLRMHIKYLIATLVKSSGKDEEAVSLTMNWLDEYSKYYSSIPEILKFEILDIPLSQSVFVRANRMARFMTPSGSWYVGDLTRIGEMHRVNVISFYRQKKDPSIFDLWQANLKMEQTSSNYLPLQMQKMSFKNDVYPSLLLQMARDYESFGLTKKAVETLMMGMKQNPDAECYDSMSNELKKLLGDLRSK